MIKNLLRDEAGAALVAVILLAIVVVAGVGWSGYRAYKINKSQVAEQDASGGANSQNSALPEESTKTKEEAKTETNPNEGYFVIKEMGLRFPLNAGIDDLVYYYKKDGAVEYAYFSSRSLLEAEEKASGTDYCKAENGPYGYISKSPTEIYPDQMKVGGAYVSHIGPQGQCTDDMTASTIQNGGITDLREAFKSVELAR